MSPLPRRLLAQLSCVAAVVLALAAAGCGGDEGIHTRLDRAERLRAAGELREALVELKSTLRTDPQNAEINQRLATVLQQKGDIADALFYYAEAHRIDPLRSDAPLAVAKLLLFEDPERSRQLIEEVLAQAPEDPLGHIRRSELALAQGDALLALDEAQRAVDLSPESPSVFRQLGVVRQAQIRERQLQRREPDPELHRAALDAYARVIELRAGEPVWRAHLLRGRILAAWPGHHGEATREFRAATRDAAQTAQTEARTTAARATWEFARSSGDRTLEREALESWVDADPTTLRAWQRLALLEERLDGSGDAVFERLLARRPRDLEAHLSRVRFLDERGRQEEALALLSDMQERGLDPARTLAAQTRLLYRAGRATEARRAAMRMQTKYPEHPSSVRVAAERALREGRLEAAAETLRGVPVGREDAETLRMLAWVELLLGRPGAGLSAIDRAVALDPGNPAAGLRLRARIQAAAADCSGALESLRELVRQGGRATPSDRTLRARCLYELGRVKEARAVLSRLLASDPPVAEAVLEFAVREARHQPERARKLAEAALEDAPDNERLFATLIHLDLARGDWRAALGRLDRHEAGGSPPRASRLLLRARVLAFGGDLDAAEQTARRALATDPKLPGGIRELAAILRRQDRLAEAVAAIERSRQRSHLSAADLTLLARLHTERGDAAAARTVLEEALAGGDAPPDAENALAYLLARRGTHLDRALQLAVSARRAQTDDPHAADTLGFVHLKSGLPEAALGQFREALRLAPATATGRGTYHYHAALALDALGRSAEARAALETALGEEGGFPEDSAARNLLERATPVANPVPTSPPATSP